MSSMRSAVVIFLVILVGALPGRAYASDLAEAISTAGKDVAASASQARPNAKGNDENPYFLPGIIILSAGGLVALYGLTHESGVECTSGRTSFSCGTTKSKATIISGAAIAGVGAYLLLKGRQSESSPEILAGPNVIGVRHHLRW